MYWKVALAQHPMYLLIREDSQCAERTAPWGEPTIARYIDRLRRCLATVRSNERLKVGFEWSGVELEMLAEDAPDVLREMCALAGEGKVAFYNGAYAQPHAQILSSEANYRQLEFGRRVYQELCRFPVRTYCHQETSVHDQMPQLLNAFGIRFATLPWFFSTLAWLDEGELVIRGFGGGGPSFVHGHEFVRWCGLDGSEVLLYLSQTGVGPNVDEWANRETMAGLLHTPPIVIDAPDLVAIDDEWMMQHSQADMVLLDDALPERLAQAPARARARFFAQWSYIDGIRAEELSRCNRRAEAAALQAEALDALAFVLLDRQARSTDAIWKTILTAQHHDVYCFGSVELRDKAITWLNEAQQSATQHAQRATQAVLDAIDTRGMDGQPLVVFNALPHRCKALTAADVPMRHPRVESLDGTAIPSDAAPLADGGSRLRFLANMDGLGYATYVLREGTAPAPDERATAPVDFGNAYYRTTVQPDGTFTSLIPEPSGDELLDVRRLAGNQLAATDSTGLALAHDGSRSRWDWQPPRHGPERELRWTPTDAMRVRRSALGMALSVGGRMGAQIEGSVEIMLYHDLPRIDVVWSFCFDEASIGLFYDDETKLRVQWPLAFDGDVYHDIAFGAIKAQADRPLLPVSWLDVSDGSKGLAYLHRGTPKHWVSERTLVNLFAWGEDTDAIGNRCKPFLWNKAFDQRLRGRHTIHCALYPHRGDWRAADLAGAARSYGVLPLACVVDRHAGHLPPRATVLRFLDENLAATAVMAAGSRLLCRVYAATGQPASAAADARGLHQVALRSLAGESIHHLAPFQIGQVILER